MAGWNCDGHAVRRSGDTIKQLKRTVNRHPRHRFERGASRTPIDGRVCWEACVNSVAWVGKVASYFMKRLHTLSDKER